MIRISLSKGAGCRNEINTFRFLCSVVLNLRTSVIQEAKLDAGENSLVKWGTEVKEIAKSNPETECKTCVTSDFKTADSDGGENNV